MTAHDKSMLKKISLIAAVILLVMGTIVAIVLVRRSQDIRQQAQEVPAEPTATPSATLSPAESIPYCYGIQDANDANDTLFKINLETGELFDEVPLGTTGVESFEYLPFPLSYPGRTLTQDDTFLVGNAGTYGELDMSQTPPAFVPIEPENAAFYTLGGVTYNLWQQQDLTVHPITGQIFNFGALVLDWNDTSEIPNFILYKLDPTDMTMLEDGFGPGVDFLDLPDEANGEPGWISVDGASISPLETDYIYGSAAYGNTRPGYLVKFNIHTGERVFSQPIIIADHPASEFIGQQLIDVEGMAFTDDGILYVNTGGGRTTPGEATMHNSLYRIDTVTAEAYLISDQIPYDSESLSCFFTPPSATPTPVPTASPTPTVSPTPEPTNPAATSTPTPEPTNPQAANTPTVRPTTPSGSSPTNTPRPTTIAAASPTPLPQALPEAGSTMPTLVVLTGGALLLLGGLAAILAL